MSSRFLAQKLIQSLILSLILIVGSPQASFGAESKPPAAGNDIRQALHAEGFTDLESERVIKTLDTTHRHYTAQKIKDLFAWFRNKGVKDFKQLDLEFAWLTPLSIENNLDPTFAELKNQWGIGIAEIEKNPRLLSASLPRLKKLRALFYKIAQLAGDKQFSCLDFTLQKRKELIKAISAEQLIQRFKVIGAIHPKRQDLSELTDSEKMNLVKLYENGELEELFVQSNGLSAKKLKYLARFINDGPPSERKAQRSKAKESQISNYEKVKLENLRSTLKAEEFSESESEKVYQAFNKREIPSDLKDRILWLKNQGIKDIKRFILYRPLILDLSVKGILEPKFHELQKNWGIGIDEIERSPKTLTVSLKRIQDLKSLLDNIAKLAGDDHFQFDHTNDSRSAKQRLTLVKDVSAEQVIERLKAIGAIRPELQDLSHLNATEKSSLAELYRQHKLQNLFTQGAELSPVTAERLSRFVNTEALQKTLKKEGFTESEIKQILKSVDQNYTVENYKNYVKWLKKQGVKDTKKLITSSPEILKYLPENKRAAKLVELIANWGYKLSEIENSMEIMKMNLERVQNTRKFFDQIASLANVPHFDLNELTSPQKKVLIIKNITNDDLFERLKDVIVTEDRRKKKKLSDFTDSEKALVAEFYKTKRDKLIDILARQTRIPFIKSTEISCELRFLRQKLQIQ